MKKEHCVTVSITSESGELTNQEIIFKEYASTPAELVQKNFAICDAIIGAVNAAMKQMSKSVPGVQ